MTPPIPPSACSAALEQFDHATEVLVADQDDAGAVQVLRPLRLLLPVRWVDLDLVAEPFQNQFQLGDILSFA